MPNINLHPCWLKFILYTFLCSIYAQLFFQVAHLHFLVTWNIKYWLVKSKKKILLNMKAHKSLHTCMYKCNKLRKELKHSSVFHSFFLIRAVILLNSYVMLDVYCHIFPARYSHNIFFFLLNFINSLCRDQIKSSFLRNYINQMVFYGTSQHLGQVLV